MPGASPLRDVGIFLLHAILGFMLHHLLPAAVQLERASIDVDPDDMSMLGQFHMLKELHVNVHHVMQLTAPLPRLHRLILRFYKTWWTMVDPQCLLSQAPALRQLVLDCMTQYLGLNKWDMEMLVHLPCQQLDLLTVVTNTIDEHTVTLLARIQCPLKLRINIMIWSGLGSAPLFSLLAGLPNLIALQLVQLDRALNALWDQCGAILPHVQRLEVDWLPLPMSDFCLPLQSILSMCPALKHVYLHSFEEVSLTSRLEVRVRFWHAFKSCAKLVSLTINCGLDELESPLLQGAVQAGYFVFQSMLAVRHERSGSNWSDNEAGQR